MSSTQTELLDGKMKARLRKSEVPENLDGGASTTTTVRSLLQSQHYKEDPYKQFENELCFPFFTLISTSFYCAVFGFEYYYAGGFAPISENPFFGPGEYSLIALYGKFGPKIFESGQYVRLIASIPMHAGVVHLLLTLLFHLAVLWPVERQHGWWKTIPVYLGSAIVGNIFSILIVPNLVSVGPEGAIAGLISMRGVEIYVKKRDRNKSKARDWIAVGISIVGCLISGLFPFIDNFAHVGGLISGIFLSMVFTPQLNQNLAKKWTISAGILGFLCCAFGLIGIMLYNRGKTYPDWCPICSKADCLPVSGFCKPLVL